MSPAMMALVVAIAGMMFPAIAGTETHTFLNVEATAAHLCSVEHNQTQSQQRPQVTYT